LGMWLSHICTFPPFSLDQVPGVFGGPGGVHAQAGGVCAIKGNVRVSELVAILSFIEGWGSRVDQSGCNCSLLL
jgi:hypothetical protein